MNVSTTFFVQFCLLCIFICCTYCNCQVLCMCSQGLADNTVIAKVNNDVWDLDRPLEGDCSLKLLKFDDPDGETIIIISLCGLVVN